MCVITLKVDFCTRCKCRYLVHWAPQMCAEQWHCVATEYSHCNQTVVVYNGTAYKLQDVERRKNRYCRHDGYLCLGRHFIYHSNDQGFESLYKPFLLKEAS